MTEGNLHNKQKQAPRNSTSIRMTIPQVPSPDSSISDSDEENLVIASTADLNTRQDSAVDLEAAPLSPCSDSFSSNDSRVVPSVTPDLEVNKDEGTSPALSVGESEEGQQECRMSVRSGNHQVKTEHPNYRYPYTTSIHLAQQHDIVKSAKPKNQNRRSRCRKSPPRGEAIDANARKENTLIVKSDLSEGHPPHKHLGVSKQSAVCDTEYDTSATTYQPMTQVALPPDHPFCNLTTQTRKSCPRGRRPKCSGENELTPSGRPMNVRVRGKMERQRKRQRIFYASPPEGATVPQATVPVKQEDISPPPMPQATAAFWRPMNLSSDSPSADSGRQSPRAESPLDLSVCQKKRKREEGDEMVRVKRAPLEPLHAGGAMVHHPLLYPGVGYYGQTVISAASHPTYHHLSQIPLAFYGQPAPWGQGVGSQFT